MLLLLLLLLLPVEVGPLEAYGAVQNELMVTIDSFGLCYIHVAYVNDIVMYVKMFTCVFCINVVANFCCITGGCDVDSLWWQSIFNISLAYATGSTLHGRLSFKHAS